MLVGNIASTQEKLAFKHYLMQSIQNCLCRYEVDETVFRDGFEKAFNFADKDFDNLRSRLLDLTLLHVFNGKELWIGEETPAGNDIPDDVRVAAYAMLPSAKAFAVSRGLEAGDTMIANVIEQAVNITADSLASGRLLQNLNKYLFGVYCKRLARNISPSAYNARKDEEPSKEQPSEICNPADEIEKRIFAREMLNLMPPQPRMIAYLRHYWGYEWPEIAERLGISINAARKALTVGLRKAREKYMQTRK